VTSELGNKQMSEVLNDTNEQRLIAELGLPVKRTLLATKQRSFNLHKMLFAGKLHESWSERNAVQDQRAFARIITCECALISLPMSQGLVRYESGKLASFGAAAREAFKSGVAKTTVRKIKLVCFLFFIAKQQC
jgi:hypothetical protein